MSDSCRAPGLVLALFLCLPPAPAQTPAASSSLQLTTTEKLQLQREARLVVDLLQNHHYSGRAFREIENREMIARYLQELDPRADFFTTEDVEFVHRRFDRTLKSVYLFRGDLQPAFEIFDLFADRARARLAWVGRRLARDFDLTVDETFSAPRKPIPSAKGAPADQRWEQQLKNQVLREILLGRTPDGARGEVARRHEEMGRRITATDSFAIRERFFDAVIRSFDPHSGYFSADSTKEFAIDMANAVTGLGLDLHKEDGLCRVSAVQPGGPADLHSTIGAGDTLLALAEADGPWIDAASRRLREIVGLLRGEAGRTVRLAYRPAGTDERIEVTLQRTRVVLPDARVHGAVSDLPGPNGTTRRIGWITLPSFYAGGEGTDTTSVARDMRELLDQMAVQKIEGLVLDLRHNPGGALTEAVAVSQLFLPRGCMMLSRGPTGKLTEHNLKEAPPPYAGPLVLLTSGHSASASEILAGALKFYRRAVVVGGSTTFGKGTAQSYIELAKLPGIGADGARDWGTLRLTAERFYQPDGRAVQRAGVTSHIVLPDFDPPGFAREAALPHALTEESITPPGSIPGPETVPAAVPDALLQLLRDRAGENFKSLPEWELWRKEQAYAQKQFADETHALQLTARKKDWEDTLAQYQDLQRIRRSLTASAAFPTRPLEIGSVQAAQAAHETRLRTLSKSAGRPLLHRLRRGEFFVETDQGRFREIALDDIGVTAFYGDTSTLADAFASAGHPLGSAGARRILEELGMLEHPTETTLLAAVGRVVGRNPSEPEVQRGTEALLRRLTELDGEMCRERPGLDIPLRESLRLTATWADWLATPRAP
jgi:carboxyl-terminal processing protease